VHCPSLTLRVNIAWRFGRSGRNLIANNGLLITSTRGARRDLSFGGIGAAAVGGISIAVEAVHRALTRPRLPHWRSSALRGQAVSLLEAFPAAHECGVLLRSGRSALDAIREAESRECSMRQSRSASATTRSHRHLSPHRQRCRFTSVDCSTLVSTHNLSNHRNAENFLLT
jgi:hypothetical protein